jgi:pimeloyl-ACP methyl ester carboxylesterase
VSARGPGAEPDGSGPEPGDPGAEVAIDALGTGEPLVLIHGLATTRQVWDLVVPALSDDRQVVTLDLPGFGQSPPADDGYELDAVAARIAAGLADHGVRAPFDLVGHSLGAGVALTLAGARPELVRRLVLVAPAGFLQLPRLAALAAASAADSMLAVRRALVPLTDLGWGRRVLLGFAAADAASMSPTQARLIVNSSAGARRTARALATIAAADLRPLLSTVPAPLGLIWGERDRTVPARTAETIRAARPDVPLELIERAGHVVMMERPEAFVAALQKLLRRLPKDSTTPASGASRLL